MLQVCGDPLTKEEAEELMDKIDTNKDGFIDINGKQFNNLNKPFWILILFLDQNSTDTFSYEKHVAKYYLT